MRDSNFNFPALGRACICVSSGIYDRRALDAPPGSLPLINSLTHLTYLTATSPRVRDIISHDGGLERLVRVLQHCARGGPAGAHLLYTYSLAFQCIVNIGVRGSEAIRTRVVEAGALDVVVFVLERYLEDVQRKRQQNQAD
ncbi:uncharacterized protein RHOBADRAFT_29284, partial [Rhodotorula graminis WP1]